MKPLEKTKRERKLESQVRDLKHDKHMVEQNLARELRLAKQRYDAKFRAEMNSRRLENLVKQLEFSKMDLTIRLSREKHNLNVTIEQLKQQLDEARSQGPAQGVNEAEALQKRNGECEAEAEFWNNLKLREEFENLRAESRAQNERFRVDFVVKMQAELEKYKQAQEEKIKRHGANAANATTRVNEVQTQLEDEKKSNEELRGHAQQLEVEVEQLRQRNSELENLFKKREEQLQKWFQAAQEQRVETGYATGGTAFRNPGMQPQQPTSGMAQRQQTGVPQQPALYSSHVPQQIQASEQCILYPHMTPPNNIRRGNGLSAAQHSLPAHLDPQVFFSGGSPQMYPQAPRISGIQGQSQVKMVQVPQMPVAQTPQMMARGQVPQMYEGNMRQMHQGNMSQGKMRGMPPAPALREQTPNQTPQLSSLPTPQPGLPEPHGSIKGTTCISCHYSYWNTDCDDADPCTNCAILGVLCERPKCENFATGTCQKNKCSRAHENDGWFNVSEYRKDLKRKNGAEREEAPRKRMRMG